METVYKREKKYNDEAGGRLSGDMDETRENGDKVQELVCVWKISIIVVLLLIV